MKQIGWKVLILLVILQGFPFSAEAQVDSFSKKRLQTVAIGSGLAYTGLLTGLYHAWYAGYPRSDFHFINDNRSWNQMDKLGHAWSSYGYGIAGIELMKWTGISRKKAIWIGGLAGTLFQTPIEILDGFSAEWGASWGDLIANSTGSALVIFQELAWDEQRIQFKYSYWPSQYAKYRPNMLGENHLSRILKDYNGQTYWLSVNPWTFNKSGAWPKWLNLSLGYSAFGMLGSEENKWLDAQGASMDYTHITRGREFLFSFDVDLQKLNIKKPWLQKLAKTLNLIKIPAPAIGYTTAGNWVFYPLKF